MCISLISKQYINYYYEAVIRYNFGFNVSFDYVMTSYCFGANCSNVYCQLPLNTSEHKMCLFILPTHILLKLHSGDKK